MLPPSLAFGSPVKTKQGSFDRLVSSAHDDIERMEFERASALFTPSNRISLESLSRHHQEPICCRFPGPLFPQKVEIESALKATSSAKPRVAYPAFAKFTATGLPPAPDPTTIKSYSSSTLLVNIA
jgi:hypothetical protein